MPEFGASRRVWIILALIVLVLLFLFSLSHRGSHGTIVGAVPGGAGSAPGSTAVPATPEPADPGTGTPGTGTSGTGSAGGSGTRRGTVLVEGTPMLPLSAAEVPGLGSDLSVFDGGHAVATSVRVESVPADEGFWIGTGPQDRIWVQLVGPPPESPYTVRRGDTVSFKAPVRRNPRGFARQVGVSAPEGAAMLTEQGEHIAVTKMTLKLHRPG